MSILCILDFYGVRSCCLQKIGHMFSLFITEICDVQQTLLVRFVEHLSWKQVIQQSVAKATPMTFVLLIKHELLFNQPASEVATLY